MKKRCVILILVLTMLLAIPAQAAARSTGAAPILTFDGTTANCSFKVFGDNASDEISVTLKLWRGSTCLATWSDSGTGYVRISETKTVARGYTYRLTADVTINGTAQPQVEVKGTCK